MGEAISAYRFHLLNIEFPGEENELSLGKYISYETQKRVEDALHSSDGRMVTASLAINGESSFLTACAYKSHYFLGMYLREEKKICFSSDYPAAVNRHAIERLVGRLANFIERPNLQKPGMADEAWREIIPLLDVIIAREEELGGHYRSSNAWMEYQEDMDLLVKAHEAGQSPHISDSVSLWEHE